MTEPRRRFRRFAASALAAFALAGALPYAGAGATAAESAPPPINTPTFPEVGRVPVRTELPNPPTYHGVTFGEIDETTSGWLIVSPASRRGYVITETSTGTVVDSFDLDTLAPRQQFVTAGMPLHGGYMAVPSAGGGYFSGDVVHAVDPVAKRVYLPIASAITAAGTFNHPDNKRQVTYFLMIDEVAFDRDPAAGTGTFTFPVLQERLTAYPMMGLAVTRHHVDAQRPGKLVAAFASPNPLATSFVVYQPIPGTFDHTLVQWDPADVPLGTPPPQNYQFPNAQPVDADGAPVVLTACATAPMSPVETSSAITTGAKNLAWGILPGPDAIHLVCQSAPQSGAVVRVALDPLLGSPSAEQALFSLGKPVVDVMVDGPGRRLLLETVGGGATQWVFDVATGRFVGAFSAHPLPALGIAAGIDQATGRVYVLTGDYCIPRRGGPALGTWAHQPQRGGLRVVESRLAPVPAPELVNPDLAYNALWRIHVDPVTQRVFVRRGNGFYTEHDRYPDCDAPKEVRPVEPFWRVFEDRRPPLAPPRPFDDAQLTTNVAEDAERTQASFLGAGSGYGVRSLVVGGLDGPAQGGVTAARSLCGRENREVLLGAVGKVEVSDQSTVAEAAGLDADAVTQEHMGDPVSRCRPQAPPEQAELNRCRANLDVREASFDQARPGTDENGDGCADRDRKNRYAASCLGDREERSPGFDDGEHVAPRDGFDARATCDRAHEKAAASGRASESSDHVEHARRSAGQAGEPVRVAHAASTVEVSRKLGGGVKVKVDSIARGVDIPGAGTIGVVRLEATSTATGRDGGARTSFTRTFCDIDVAGLVVSGCLGDEKQQRSFVDRLNSALGGRGRVVLRTPDETLAAGTPHGYLAGVQRDGKELFADQSITRDMSLAVPALEIIFYQGEGSDRGVARQVVHLAGAQATTSYGIACLYGRRADGTCTAADEEAAGVFAPVAAGFDDAVATAAASPLPAPASVAAGRSRESLLTRIVRGLPRAVAEALRLLFNNPRELGLLAALWALLYAPCYLGDRRRAVRDVARRRLTAQPSA